MYKIIRHPLCLGTLIFILQLTIILLICPEKPLIHAWLSLASHWDSEWYEAIAQYGYINTSFPHTSGLHSANVVFFPGYPYLARCLILLFGLNAKTAILLIAQLATWIIWCVIFHLLRQKHWSKQLSATLLIMFFPTSWFLYMGYAESLFILMAILMLWSATQQKWALSSLSGFYMTATRLIGLPILGAPIFTAILCHYNDLKIRTKVDCYRLKMLVFVAIFGSFGCISFLIYCQFAFDSWHLYFDMERLFWHGTADPFFLFKAPTWFPPPIGYPADYTPPLPNFYQSFFTFKFFQLAAYSFSETLVPLFLWLFLFVAALTYKNRHNVDKTSLTWLIAAILILLFNCLSLSFRYYESMSRCLYPAWILFIISEMIHPQGGNLFRYVNNWKLVMVLSLYLYLSGGFWLQLLNRYFLGWWVA